MMVTADRLRGGFGNIANDLSTSIQYLSSVHIKTQKGTWSDRNLFEILIEAVDHREYHIRAMEILSKLMGVKHW